MRVQMLTGVMHEGRPLMPPEIHELPDVFAKTLIWEGRAVPAPEIIEQADPVAEQRDPAPRGVRRR